MLRKTEDHTAAQTLVEFALVLPSLLLLMVSLVDFGVIMHAQIVVTNAALWVRIGIV